MTPLNVNLFSFARNRPIKNVFIFDFPLTVITNRVTKYYHHKDLVTNIKIVIPKCIKILSFARNQLWKLFTFSFSTFLVFNFSPAFMRNYVIKIYHFKFHITPIIGRYKCKTIIFWSLFVDNFCDKPCIKLNFLYMPKLDYSRILYILIKMDHFLNHTPYI